MAQPIFFIVADDQRVLDALAVDLRRRFGTDYRVLGAASADAALATLADLSAGSEEVALLFADQNLARQSAVEVLGRAHAIVPSAKRVLMINRGDWSAAHPAVSAMALGLIDYHLYNPWRPLERVLYPAVSEFLASWDKSREPDTVALRIVGEQRSARAHEVRDVLTRVGIPYWFHSDDSEAGRRILREAGADGSRLPVVVYFDGTALVDPSHAELMATLGLQTKPGVDRCDVAIIGAGPAGLAAAVYAASEGLETLVLEPVVPGGQAGTSSLIRNYLGFQRGVSGEDLTNRAVEQAWLFGADLVLSQEATWLGTRGADRLVRTTDGSQIAARAVVIATGVAWKRLGLPSLENLIGAGVFYGAAGAEARAMTGRDVFLVGAGNSAGQAALHLAKYAATVTMVVRGDSLGRSMSDYLVTEIEKSPNIQVRLRTQVADGGGRGHLETLTLVDLTSNATEVVPAAALFLLIGAEPHTDWLAGCVERDDRGFVMTGRDLVRAGAPPAGWPLERPPLLLETSVPGVFAAGDVRHRSVKRVASAVGEGAIAIQLVHEYLAE
jgi:thioredoxin reductase (NADPH)